MFAIRLSSLWKTDQTEKDDMSQDYNEIRLLGFLSPKRFKKPPRVEQAEEV